MTHDGRRGLSVRHGFESQGQRHLDDRAVRARDTLQTLCVSVQVPQTRASMMRPQLGQLRRRRLCSSAFFCTPATTMR